MLGRAGVFDAILEARRIFYLIERLYVQRADSSCLKNDVKCRSDSTLAGARTV